MAKVKTLSHDLYETFTGRHKYLLKEKGLHAANKYLVFTLGRTILPRVDSVNAAHSMDFNPSLQFMDEADTYHRLPNLNDKSVRQLAQDVAGQLKGIYETRCEEMIADKDGDNTILFEDSTQVELYAQLAGMARAFNVSPMHWKKYRKGRLDAHLAIASLSRLVNPDWWVRQLKAQRTRWREALLIAIGNVNRSKSPYTSKQAIREVKSRRQSNLDYLKSCDIENIETGERFKLIDKVMASISNPEIRRMELMSTIAGIEGYASFEKRLWRASESCQRT